IAQDIDRDHWMTPTEALEYGLIDGIVGAPADPRANGHLRNGHDRGGVV
ncbi:MAG: ATP-dependent Clp protease proteolytic subunit, partial [Chloroflexi bacterium]|nr:ATP-dependent Clp protease proteolytic subunit [Chloroflexota bacterium]